MSDSKVTAHLDGIISDFEALKRSFEVEDVDTSANSSPGSRRAPSNPNHRPVMSPTSVYYRELGASNNNNGSISKTIMGGGGSKPPEPISRGRTELSIDISSKQVDPTSPGSLRFGTKRPEVLGHSKTPEVGHKREVTFAKTPQDVVIRGGARTPEPPSHARRFDPPNLGDGPAARTTPGISVTKAPETTGNGKNNHENHGHHAPVHHPHHPNPHHNTIVTTIRCSSPNRTKSPNPDRSEVKPSHSNMSTPQPPAKGASHAAGDFSYVGIDAILEQMRRKAMKQGFELNIMIVGQSGLGKSTLMNTLFKSKVSRKSVVSTPEERIPKTIEIKSISHDIEEKGVRMKLTVIDTPGFGDHINNENCWQPIMKFINDQYEQYLQEEININRKKRIPDSRVHCCMYFIPPTGHCLRPLDVEFMSRLSKVVNIVPVIAKADTLTLEERDFFKQTIREGLRANGIDVYPQEEFDEDSDDRMINDKIREMIPFAVVGSNQEYQVNGKRLLGRKTKWGTIEVENIAHCEFAHLRDLLIRTHMQNIKDITSSIHYEVYRVRRLNETGAQPNAQPPNTLVNPQPQQANGVAAQHQVLTHEM
ncbi:neuronal-specific septin-3 isoform X1 [Oncorhynchus mykiss]|uniref:Septin 9b n=2 Tax=Oncorhynchus mykiss TaxID=8022 RepID=A0A8C7W6G0_ONCMY|nr:neuronal-specific septin-3 isoform X1 [Oncorhynchus mykiss]XP_036796381.1 neuronal-specific septin-3 isoform X1 [Oncorhynchus mykiss]